MTRLQTLWGLFARQARLDAKDREARIGWVAGVVGRQLASFKELSKDEADRAITEIQKHLPAELLKRRRPDRATARAYGTAGRKSAHKSAEVRMADAASLNLIWSMCLHLGWDKDRLDAFLRSPKSPLRSGTIRTQAEANRVVWALKAFVRREKRGGE